MNELDKKFKKELDDEDEWFIKEYGKIIKAFFSKMKVKKIKSFEDIDKITKRKISVSKSISKLFIKHGTVCFNMGRLHGKYEVIASGRKVKKFEKLKTKLADPLPSEVALKFWIYSETAEKAIEERQLALAGNVTGDMIESIKNILIDKLKGADELNIEKRIVDTLETNLERGELISITESTYYYNKGRVTSFNEDGVEYVQFSAIMDSRTSPQCQSRHGLIMRTDSPELGMNTPPLHGRCRSILKACFDIPDTKQLDWADTVPLPKGWRTN